MTYLKPNDRRLIQAYLRMWGDLLSGPMALDPEDLDPTLNDYDWGLVVYPDPKGEPPDMLLAALYHGMTHGLGTPELVAYLRTIPELNDAFTLE